MKQFKIERDFSEKVHQHKNLVGNTNEFTIESDFSEKNASTNQLMLRNQLMLGNQLCKKKSARATLLFDNLFNTLMRQQHGPPAQRSKNAVNVCADATEANARIFAIFVVKITSVTVSRRQA